MPKPRRHQRERLSGLIGQSGGFEGTEDTTPDNSDGPLPGDILTAAFADVLRHQPDSVGYIVTYQSNDDAPGAWKRVADYDVENLKEYGIGSDRLKIVYAGKDEGTTHHFWVLPKGEPLPIAEAIPDRLADKAVRIHEYDEYGFADLKAQEFAFKGIAQLLKEYPDAKVCYMVIPRVPKDDESADEDNKKPEQQTELTKHTPLPKADFHQIVEQWRARLISDLKISPDRIIILYPTGVDEQFQGKMQSWLVPKNAVLPAPPKVDDDDPPNDDVPPIRHN
jgi:hypothetical protein